MTKDDVTYEGKNYTIYFDDDTHTYFLEGEDVEFQPIMSTTQILHLLFPKKYDGIAPEILKKAAERGTNIHNAIYEYEMNGVKLNLEVKELQGYCVLKKYYCIKSVNAEIPILLKVDDVWITGRLDAISEVKNLKTAKKELCIIDYKTTAQLDIEYLLWQLNIYKLGAEKTYGYQIENLYGMHLKNDTRKLQMIPIITEENVKTRILEVLGKGKNYNGKRKK